MKHKELKNLRTEEIKKLSSLVSKKKLELVKLQIKKYTSKEKNAKVIKGLKREIAQVLTLINEKMANAVASNQKELKV